MTEISFYQLTRPLDAVLPRLLEKAVASGHRIVLRADDDAVLKRLDTLLWTYDQASFLPHAVDGAFAGAQPVLLTRDRGPAANGATIAAVVDGVFDATFAGLARILYLFDSGDDAALTAARAHWRDFRDRDGVTASYWREDETGRWSKAG